MDDLLSVPHLRQGLRMRKIGSQAKRSGRVIEVYFIILHFQDGIPGWLSTDPPSRGF